MGMYDRDWYRSERRQQRLQQPNTLQSQPDHASRRSGPPGINSAAAILAILVAVVAAVIILGFA